MFNVQSAVGGLRLHHEARGWRWGAWEFIHVQSILRIQRHSQRSLRLHVTQLRVVCWREWICSESSIRLRFQVARGQLCRN
jgi:hypothetical protein